MRYFGPKTNEWGEKYNFVDESNVVVGFDADKNCCESFGWFITRNPDFVTPVPFADNVCDDGCDERLINEIIAGFTFDKTRHAAETNKGMSNEENWASFRLVNGDRELFLHLYNDHNGYYSHGFEFTAGDKVIAEGSL